MNAFAAENDRLFNFYSDRFREGFVPVFDEWVALDPLNNVDAPLSPFDLDNYQVLELEDAARLAEEADAFVTESREARDNAQSYTIALVLLAAAIFFAGISTKFSAFRARMLILGLGAALFVGTTIWIGVLPKSVSL